MVFVCNMLFLYVVALSCSFVRMGFSPSNNGDSNFEFPEEVETDAVDLGDDVPVLSNFAHPSEKICPEDVKCGFYFYDRETRKRIQPFLKSCTCPEGFVCVKAGESKLLDFFYYKCKVLEGTESFEDIEYTCPTEEFKPEVVIPVELEIILTGAPESTSTIEDVPDAHVLDSIPDITGRHDEMNSDPKIEENDEEIDVETKLLMLIASQMVRPIKEEVARIMREEDSKSKASKPGDPRDEL